MKTQTYIEVNGKRYDARTGKLLGETKTVHSSGITMDGISKRQSHIVRPTTAHGSRKVQKSQTLMRTAVKKPTTSKTVTHSNHEQVHSASRSPLISRFGDIKSLTQPVTPRVEPLMFAHERSSHANAQTVMETLPVHHTAPVLTPSNKITHNSHSLIERAMTASNSHTAPKHITKKKHRVSHRLGISHKTARAGSALLAVLVLGTFFAYQNIPNFAMRVAATRAGFEAAMPGYRPSGFAMLGPVQYKSGEVTVKFGSSTGDGRAYALTQRASQWNNDALLANFVLNSDSQYQTYQDSNKTIYIYDNGAATWVNEGVWYQLEGNASLTTDQISRIASSM